VREAGTRRLALYESRSWRFRSHTIERVSRAERGRSRHEPLAEGFSTAATAPRIRAFRDDDGDGAAALLRELVPYWLVTGEMLRHWMAAAPERTHGAHWIAERDGELVAWAEAEFRLSSEDPDIGLVWVGVREDARDRGLGGRLYELAAAHLTAHGARKLETWAADATGREFVERRGFVPTRSERMSTLEPRLADLSPLPALEAAAAREGYRVVRLADVRDRPRELHALFNEAHRDVPTDDAPRDLDYDEWTKVTWQSPLLDFELSAVVLHGERPVAFAWLLADREGRRAEHELTGTLRSYRGRGLARLAKLAAIRWSAEAGIERLLTGNDSENAPMLAVNKRLGYRPTIVVTELAKELGAPNETKR
jgi:GNAT superfamily N-acetyltransferase